MKKIILLACVAVTLAYCETPKPATTPDDTNATTTTTVRTDTTVRDTTRRDTTRRDTIRLQQPFK
jgi:hypothetical protein